MSFPKTVNSRLIEALDSLEQIPLQHLTSEQELAIKTIRDFLDIPELDADVTEYDEWQSYDPDC